MLINFPREVLELVPTSTKYPFEGPVIHVSEDPSSETEWDHWNSRETKSFRDSAFNLLAASFQRYEDRGVRIFLEETWKNDALSVEHRRRMHLA